MSKTIKICDCTLRDGQQSLIATRMRIEDMLPILSKMDETLGKDLENSVLY